MLAVIETHPIQYHAPVYRVLQQQLGVPVTAIYGSDFSVAGYRDAEFGTTFAWDTDLLSGYTPLFLSRVDSGGATSAEAVSTGGLRDMLRAEKYDDAVKYCETPSNWRVAVPQLVAMAIRNRKEPLSRIKRDLVVKFESDVIGNLDRYLSYIYTYTRMGPLAGLYGTVVSMIAAFARMGQAGETRVDPGVLENPGLSDVGLHGNIVLLGLDCHLDRLAVLDQLERVQDPFERDALGDQVLDRNLPGRDVLQRPLVVLRR